MMDLKEALRRCDEVLRGACHVDREALSVVLAAARESYASRVVAETHALVERAREMERPHPFERRAGVGAEHCFLCGARESDSIHQQAETAP